MTFLGFLKRLRGGGLESFGLYYGRYRAIVHDNADPEALGRLRLKVPQVYGDDVPDYWAWPVGLAGGDQKGVFDIPEVGAHVYVSFEFGRPRYPLWEAGWYPRPSGLAAGNGAASTVGGISSSQSRLLPDGTVSPVRPASTAPFPARRTPPTNSTWRDEKGNRIDVERLRGHEAITLVDQAGNYERWDLAQGEKMVRWVGDETRETTGDRSVSVGGDSKALIGGDGNRTTLGNEAAWLGGSRTDTVEGGVTSTVGGSVVESVGGSQRTMVGGSRQRAVGGSWTEQIVGAISILTSAGLRLMSTGATIIHGILRVSITSQGDILINSTAGPITIKADTGAVIISGGAAGVQIVTAGPVTYTAASHTFNGHVTFNDGTSGDQT
ncbi:MAG: phage baseplate assembly protein V [Sumerlaeia bacterium]